MLQSVFHSALLLSLSCATMVFTASETGSAINKRQDYNNDAAAYTDLKACYNDCKINPESRKNREAVFLCTKVCDRVYTPGPRYGCKNNYCWSRCTGSGFGVEWCYTTRSYSQSYSYVGCQQDSECNRDWKCAGPCTISIR